MTEALEDTWHSRELPVLRETARLLEEREPVIGVRINEVAATLGVEDEVVFRSMRILESAGLVEVAWVMPSTHGRVTQISGQARQMVGQWPTAETALERMVAALEAIADNTDDEDERTKLQKFAAFLRGSATTVGLSVASAAITGQLPGQ